MQSLNNALSELLTALNLKPFQKRQGSRYQQFTDIEKSTLLPLPKTEYDFATLQYQTVPPDYHVRIEGHYYSVPYQHISTQDLQAISTPTTKPHHNLRGAQYYNQS